MTQRIELLEEVIREIRMECEIGGDLAADWKSTAEAIALKYVPELQSKKMHGRPPMPPKTKFSRHIIKLAKVGYCRQAYNLTVRKAAAKAGIKWGTFTELRRKYPAFWEKLKDNPDEIENFYEWIPKLITSLEDDIEAFGG